jgi:hypothetical protein
VLAPLAFPPNLLAIIALRASSMLMSPIVYYNNRQKLLFNVSSMFCCFWAARQRDLLRNHKFSWSILLDVVEVRASLIKCALRSLPDTDIVGGMQKTAVLFEKMEAVAHHSHCRLRNQ